MWQETMRGKKRLAKNEHERQVDEPAGGRRPYFAGWPHRVTSLAPSASDPEAMHIQIDPKRALLHA